MASWWLSGIIEAGPCRRRLRLRALPVLLMVLMASGRASIAAPAEDLIAALSPGRGDRVTIETAPASDGRTRIALRGDVYDCRRFLKAIFAALSAERQTGTPFDLDLDIAVATLVGFNGEALHGVTLKLSGQGGEIRTFELAARLGDGVDLKGDLRSNGRGERFIHLETKDAGAFFRFTDLYRRIQEGDMWVAMPVPAADRAPRDGTLLVRDFRLVDESELRPLVPPAGRHRPDANARLAFSRLRIGFTSSPGLITVRDGVLVGTSFGATARGTIDLAHDAVALRGLAIPLWASEPAPGIIPQLAPPEASLIGMTYTLAGPFRAPVLKLDPVDPVAPAELRKLFERVADDKVSK